MPTQITADDVLENRCREVVESLDTEALLHINQYVRQEDFAETAPKLCSWLTANSLHRLGAGTIPNYIGLDLTSWTAGEIAYTLGAVAAMRSAIINPFVETLFDAVLLSLACHNLLRIENTRIASTN